MRREWDLDKEPNAGETVSTDAYKPVVWEGESGIASSMQCKAITSRSHELRNAGARVCSAPHVLERNWRTRPCEGPRPQRGAWEVDVLVNLRANTLKSTRYVLEKANRRPAARALLCATGHVLRVERGWRTAPARKGLFPPFLSLSGSFQFFWFLFFFFGSLSVLVFFSLFSVSLLFSGFFKMYVCKVYIRMYTKVCICTHT